MKKFLLLLLIVPFLFVNFRINVYAIEVDEIKENKTSVLQVVVIYTDDEGKEHPVQGGSGFLIGEIECGVEYVITAKEVTSVPNDVAEQVIETYAEDKEIFDLDYTVKAVIRRDVMVNMQLVAESDEMGFAIWRLSQPLYGREPLILCDSDVSNFMGQSALALGFSTAPNLEGETIYYTMDEMVSQSGVFIGDGSEGNIKLLYHDIVPTVGMIGGPILNEAGDVVAINQSKEGQNGYYSLQITEVLPILEAMGIPYTTTGEMDAKIQAELDAIVHKEELQHKIDEVEALDSSLYRKDSYEFLIEILTEAKTVNDNEESTQEEVDATLESLNAAYVDLEMKTPTWIILVVIGSAVLVLAIAISIVIIRTKPKRELMKKQRIEEMTITQAAPVFEEKTAQKDSYKKLVNQNSNHFEEKEYVKPVVIEETYGETTVFVQDDDSMELPSNDKRQKAYLIRKRTGEKIMITEREFVLGKDASQTDYCITGNSAVSRSHAVIICRDSEYEVSDKNATNGTYVNNIKVAPFQKASIKDGDILKLADEDFEFKITEE